MLRTERAKMQMAHGKFVCVSSDGALVNFGNADADGANVNRNRPDSDWSNLGAVFSRRIGNVPLYWRDFVCFIHPPSILPIS